MSDCPTCYEPLEPGFDYCGVCGSFINQKEDEMITMIIYKTKSTYHLQDRTTGKTTIHTGELTLPALDAIQAATAATQAVSLAAGKRAAVTNIQLSVSIAINKEF